MLTVRCRLTKNFENCLHEMLRNLHDNASNNVVFCVTSCKASNYGPGDTYGVLATFCARQPKLRDLELSRGNVFCFENETVRYLAEVTLDRTQRASVQISWEKSAETARRLLALAVKVKPHSVIETLSLNNARRAIVALVQPLVQTAKCVAVNVDELKQAKTKVAFSPSKDLSGGRVEIELRRFRFVQRSYSATVCTSSACRTVDKNGVVYERVCHDHCRWSPTIRMCRKFNIHGACRHCGCSYRQHVWSTCVPEVTYEKLVLNMSEIEQRKNRSMDEVTTLVDTCAKLTTFLNENSFFDTLGDLISDGIQREMDGVGECPDEKRTRVIHEGLERFLVAYQECMATVGAGKYSPNDVHEMIHELFTLPINGAELKNGVDIVQTSTDVAVKRRRKVFDMHFRLFSTT